MRRPAARLAPAGMKAETAKKSAVMKARPQPPPKRRKAEAKGTEGRKAVRKTPARKLVAADYESAENEKSRMCIYLYLCMYMYIFFKTF